VWLHEALKFMDEKLQIAGKIDHAIDQMMLAITKVKQAAGSNVKLPKAELDLLAQMETARDVIMDVLKNQYDRTLLHDVFGGNCARIVRIQVMCKSVEFSAMNQGDQRLPTCLRACESLEKVLVDLGEGEALRTAQASIYDIGNLAGWQPPALEPAEGASAESHAARRKDSDYTSSTSSRIMSLVEADAERRESRMRTCLAQLEVRLSEQLEGCKQTLQQSVTNLEARLAKVEAQVRELSAEAQLVDMVSDLGQVRAEVEHKSTALTRRLEKLESRTTGIETQAVDTTQRVSRISENLEHCNATMKQQCTEIAERLSEKLSHSLGDVKKRCADITEAVSVDLKMRTASLEQQLTTLAEVDQQQQKDLAGAREDILQRAAQAGEQMRQLQQSVTQSYMQEIDKLKTTTNLDPLWQSFAHVGSMVNKLQLRLDDIERVKERNLWETPRKQPVARSQSLGAADKSPSIQGRNCRAATDDVGDRDFGDCDFGGRSGRPPRI